MKRLAYASAAAEKKSNYFAQKYSHAAGLLKRRAWALFALLLLTEYKMQFLWGFFLPLGIHPYEANIKPTHNLKPEWSFYRVEILNFSLWSCKIE